MSEHDEVRGTAPPLRAAAPERDEAMGEDEEPICAADGTLLVSASGEPPRAPSEGSAAQAQAQAQAQARDAAGSVYAYGHFL